MLCSLSSRTRWCTTTVVFALATVAADTPSLHAQAVPPAAPIAAPPALPQSGVVPHDAARERVLLAQVRVPTGFTAKLFAAPPVAMYPVCLTTAADGAVYVCVDPNLSLTATKGRGRVVRLVDSNGDGAADTYSVFAAMDSPRGVAHDGRTLYVMHPPALTAYRDTTGDGIADVTEDLVTGLGFDLDFRGADHTTNGITLGIDGWLYIAVGDYGFRKAVGKDGSAITHRGGGVVRVRTDGTGLELYARGTRNIYDVAVDPFLNVFTRDNTNDGDGWDIRLHHLLAGVNVGYPALYKNFATEHMPSLADYGGGSGTGGLWLQDPRWPNGFGNTLYTTDWLTNQVLRHPFTPKGGSFTVQQDPFVTVPHPADLAIDPMAHLYVASLSGGSYTYQGDSVGYVVRVTPSGVAPARAPVIGTSSNAELRVLLGGANSELRVQSQREILRRGIRPGVAAAITALAQARQPPAYARVAALFTLEQLLGAASHGVLHTLSSDADAAVRAAALRALVDDPTTSSLTTTAILVARLADPQEPVQLAAIAALVRTQARDAAPSLLQLTTSPDAAVAHVAVNALVALDASAACLAVLDGTPAVRAGALQALQQMHSPAVVSALIARATRATDGVAETDVVLTLARLAHREATWNGEWWGTRPSFIGPYYAPTRWEESARIVPVLRRALLSAPADTYAALIAQMVRLRVFPQGASALLLATALIPAERERVVDLLVGHAELPASAISTLADLTNREAVPPGAIAELLAAEDGIIGGALPLVRGAAGNPAVRDSVRARLVGMLSAVPGRAGLDAASAALVSVTPVITPAGTAAGPLEAAWRRFVGDRRRLQELDYFIDASRAASPDLRVLGFAVLLQSVRGGRAPAAIADTVQPVLHDAWRSRAAYADLARAVRIMRLDAAYATQLATPPAMPPADAASALPWIPLFNGKDLKDWDIKFTGSPVGVNLRNTFRVTDGMLQVRYDQWPTFNGEFGHIFHKTRASHYLVAVEYRFVGEQVAGAGAGNGWAIRNNGLMVHAQSARSMGLMQDFPISLEVQMLGGLGRGTRTTGNLCTPGTHVMMHEKLVTTHCINSSSVTLDGDQWVRIEALVLGDSVIKHIVNGDTVLTYAKPQMGGGAANNTVSGVLAAGQALVDGFIALQAETAPIDIRKVEMVNLVGCMTPVDLNFRSYFVKANPAACKRR